MSFPQALTDAVSSILTSYSCSIGNKVNNELIFIAVMLTLTLISSCICVVLRRRNSFETSITFLFASVVTGLISIAVTALIFVTMSSFKDNTGVSLSIFQTAAEKRAHQDFTHAPLFKTAMLCHETGCVFSIPGGVGQSMFSDPDVVSMKIRSVRNPLPETVFREYLEGKMPIRFISITKKDDHYYGYFSLEKWGSDRKVLSSQEHIIEVNLEPVLWNYLGKIDTSSADYNEVSHDAEKNFEASRG